MKRKLASLLAAGMLLAALTACGGNTAGDTGSAENPDNAGSEAAPAGDGVYAEDGQGVGSPGDTVHTYFFDFVVGDTYLCDTFAGHSPADGNKLLVVEMTVTNTSGTSLPMFDTDFMVLWDSEDGEDSAYAVPITLDPDTWEEVDIVSEEQLPHSYQLAIDEAEHGLLVYEVPAGSGEFAVAHLEMFDDDSFGDTFYVYFTVEP